MSFETTRVSLSQGERELWWLLVQISRPSLSVQAHWHMADISSVKGAVVTDDAPDARRVENKPTPHKIKPQSSMRSGRMMQADRNACAGYAAIPR